jgi:membrane associated rhomboid family serine protease
MGIYDRDYSHEQQRPQIKFSMPKITPVVKWLLIINGAVFLLTAIPSPLSRLIFNWFAVYTTTNSAIFLQPWRYITYQFLHDGFSHILFNMFVLFMFGTMLEKQWGTHRFIKLYLICGAAGGILYALLVLVNALPPGSLVGASGAILGIIGAVAVLYPSMRVYFFGIFPIPMPVLALIIAAGSVIGFLRAENPGGEAAHLSGLAVGALMVIYQPLMGKRRVKKSEGLWQKKQQLKQDFHKEIDRILDKVHTQGIKSLTRKERSILKRATELEQQQ